MAGSAAGPTKPKKQRKSSAARRWMVRKGVPRSRARRPFVSGRGAFSPRCTQPDPCYCAPAHPPVSRSNSMNIHEYQAKEVLRGFGVPVPKGKAAFTVEEAVAAAQELGGPVWVLKAQIHAGGRGKGGGVKVVKSIEDVKKQAEAILGMTVVTHQTGPAGRLVKRLYIEDGSAIERELYLSALVDRATSRIAFIVSTEGGMDIEDVAHKTPEKIHTFQVEPVAGYSPYVGN